MLSITDYYRSTKENYHEVPLHTSQNGHHQKYTTNAEGVVTGELAYTIGGNVNGYIHYGEQHGDSFKN